MGTGTIIGVYAAGVVCGVIAACLAFVVVEAVAASHEDEE